MKSFASTVFKIIRTREFLVKCLAGVTLLSFTADFFSLGDRLCHFRLYWAATAAIITVWLALKRCGKLALIGLCLMAAHAVSLGKLWTSAMPVTSAPGMTIISANLYANNPRKAEAVAAVFLNLPEVVVLIEVTPEWHAFIQPYYPVYPHRLGVDSGGSTWLLSKLPLSQERITLMGESGGAKNNLLEATVEYGGKKLRMVAVHSPTPRGAARIAQQHREADSYLPALTRDPSVKNCLLLGDFNTTPFSSVYSHILASTQLRDIAQGGGYKPTWGPRVRKSEPWLPWLGLPIDHAFVSPNLQSERSLGYTPGSDHRHQRLIVAL